MSYADREDEWGGPRSAAEEAMEDLRCELERMTELAQAEENKAIEMADRIKSLEGVIEGYQEHVQELEAARAIESAALQAANELIEAQRAAIDLLQGSDERAHTLQGRVDDLDRECADLAECMKDMRTAYDGLVADVGHWRSAAHTGEKAAAQAKTMVDLLTKERGQDIARILELEKQLRNAQSESSCWRESFELAHGQLKTAREDCANATHELIDAHAALSALGVPGSEEESLIVRLGRLHAPLPK